MFSTFHATFVKLPQNVKNLPKTYKRYGFSWETKTKTSKKLS